MLWGKLCSSGTVSLIKSWSVRKGGGNGPSKAMGLVRALPSGKWLLPVKTNLSVQGDPSSLQELSTGEVQGAICRDELSVLIYGGVTLRVKK